MEEQKTHHHHHHHHSKKAKPVAKGKFSLMLNIAIVCNWAFAIFAFVAGFYAYSIGLISDAILTVANVLAITIALYIHRMSVEGNTHHRTYKYRYASIYLRLASILIMLLSAGALAFEALRRNSLPIAEDDNILLPNGSIMLKVAIIGIVVHAITAIFLTLERRHNSVAGTPTAFWLSTILSVIIAIAGVVVTNIEDDLFDNIAALFGAGMMIAESIPLLYTTLRYSMGGATDDIDRNHVISVFKTHPNVKGFGHLHIMAVNLKERALMAHIALNQPEQEHLTKHQLRESLIKLGLHHVTFEVSTNAD